MKGIVPVIVYVAIALAITTVGTYLIFNPLTNYIIDGDTVYINDTNLYLSANPHTIIEPQEVTFQLISKTYGGSADIMFGFDYPGVQPKTALYYNPRNLTEQKSYTCENGNWFNYTISPNHFWCWTRTTTNTSAVIDTLVFEHDFVSASGNTAYWSETHQEDWQDIAGIFSSVDYQYGGMNKWYYTTFDVEQNKRYTMKSYIDIPFRNIANHKYWVCVKPHSETIAQAEASGHLYCLDPWWDSSWGTRLKINITESTGYDRTYEPVTYNMTGLSISNCAIETRLLKCDAETTNCDGGDTIIPVQVLSGDDSTWCQIVWQANVSANSWRTYFIYTDNPTATTLSYTSYHNLTNDGTYLRANATQMTGSTAGYDAYWVLTDLSLYSMVWQSTELRCLPNSNTKWGLPISSMNTYASSLITGLVMTQKKLGNQDVSKGNNVTYTVYNNYPVIEFNQTTWDRSGAGYSNQYMPQVGIAGKDILTTGYINNNPADINSFATKTWSNSNTDGHVLITRPKWFAQVTAGFDGYAMIPGIQSGVTNISDYYTYDYACGGGAGHMLNVYTNASIPANGHEHTGNYWIFLDGSSATDVRNQTIQWYYKIFNPLGVSYISTDYLPASISNNNYMTTSYELINTPFNVTLTSNESATVTAVLNYNGTNYAGTATNTTPTVWSINKTINIPLLSSNATSVDWFWNFTIIYETSTYYNFTSTTTSQTQLYGTYFGTPGASSSTVISGDNTTLSANLTNSGLATMHTINMNYYNTSYTPSVSGSTYYYVVTAPFFAATSTINYNFSFVITDGVNLYTRNSSTGILTVTPTSIINCSTGGKPTINFRYYKEESPYSAINATHNLAITIWKSSQTQNATFNFTLPSNINHTLCISPNTADAYAFSIQEYVNVLDLDGTKYPTRTYYLNNLHLTNVTQNVDLYLLNTTYASVIGMNVVDQYGFGMPNIIIDAQRYYPGENMYRTVTRGFTNADGESVLRLYKCTEDANVLHKFTLYQNFLPIASFDSVCIIDDIVTLKVTAENTDWWHVYDDVAGGCQWFNATQLLLCQYAATDSYDAELNVEQIQISGSTAKCNETTSGTTGSLQCDLSGMTTEQYYYFFKVTNSDGVTRVLDSGTIMNIGRGEYNQMGIFIAFLLFVFMAFVGWQNPMIMMLLSIVAIVAGFAVGLYEVSYTGLISIVIAGAIIMYGAKNG